MAHSSKGSGVTNTATISCHTILLCRSCEQIGVNAVRMIAQQLFVSPALRYRSFVKNKNLVCMLDS